MKQNDRICDNCGQVYGQHAIAKTMNGPVFCKPLTSLHQITQFKDDKKYNVWYTCAGHWTTVPPRDAKGNLDNRARSQDRNNPVPYSFEEASLRFGGVLTNGGYEIRPIKNSIGSLSIHASTIIKRIEKPCKVCSNQNDFAPTQVKTCWSCGNQPF